MSWEIYLTDEVNDWLDHLLEHDADSHRQVVAAVEALADAGPNLGRPLVDRVKASALHNLKELRPGSAGSSEIRILFTFDPWRSAILWWPATSPGTGLAGTARRSDGPRNFTRST